MGPKLPQCSGGAYAHLSPVHAHAAVAPPRHATFVVFAVHFGSGGGGRYEVPALVLELPGMILGTDAPLGAYTVQM